MTSFNDTRSLHSNVPSYALLIFKATATGAIFVLNIFANSLSLIVFPKIRSLNPVTRVFMTSMTLSDIGIGFSYILPVLAATVQDKWPFGYTGCAVQAFTNNAFGIASFASLISVNFERFIAVTRPFRYPNLINVSRALLVTSGIWFFSLTLSALNSFIMPGRSVNYIQNMHTCATGPIDPTDVDKTGTLLVVLFVIIPLGLTLAMFLRLYLFARFHVIRIAAQDRAMGKKSDRRAFTTFFIMTVCLVVGWSPHTTLFVYENLTRENISPWLGCFAQLLAFSNTIINVIIYYLRNTTFRQTAKRMLVSRIPCTNVTFQTPVVPLDSTA